MRCQELHEKAITNIDRLYTVICFFLFSGPVATIDLKGPSKVEYGKTASLVAKCNIGSLDASHFTAKWQRIEKGKAEDLDLLLNKYHLSTTDLKHAKLVIKDVCLADKGTYQLLLCKDDNYISSQFVLNVHMKLGTHSFYSYY